MSSDENYPQNNVVSRRRLPFDSNVSRLSSSKAMKRSVSSNYPRSKLNYRQEIFLNKSSSSSITDDENDEEKVLDETMPENNTRTDYDEKRKALSTNQEDFGRSMIGELLQSNADLKKEIRDIRRQIKHHNGTTKKSTHHDRSFSTTLRSNRAKKSDPSEEPDECPYLLEPEYQYDPSKLQQYKKEAIVYKQQLDACQETIAQLRKTVETMEKKLEDLRTPEQRSMTNNNTDHRFIHELFHLCIKQTSRSSKSPTTTPSHQDMKTFIRQTFNELIKSSCSSSISFKMSAMKNNESNHFVCKCADRIHPDHRPSAQFSLNVIEQCQSLFDVVCYTQLPTALNEVYYRYGELMNFKRSIASTLGVTESTRLVSCPKLVKTLQQLMEDARSNELITFKKMAKINDMTEAISKIRSYDDFVPYYHQFIEQMANLLEVSKGDEIMPAIKTLKLLAHADSRRPSFSGSQQVSQSLTRTSYDDYPEKNLLYPKSLGALPSIDSSKLEGSEKGNDETEQTQTEIDQGNS